MTKILARDPERRCKPVAEWPEADRELWLASLQPGDVVDPGGARAGFAFHSNRKLASGYGRWLQWLEQRDLLDADQPPAARIIPARVAAYVADLSAVNRPQTRLSRVVELHEMARVMDPAQDWTWFKGIEARLRAQRVPARPKAPRIVAINELLQLGQHLMATAADAGSPLAQAIRYRDGLAVAFLAARPLRRRNLAGLRIGQSLVRRAGIWWLEIAGEETKTARPISLPAPSVLSEAIDIYLAVHHPILASRCAGRSRTPEAALWLSKHGMPMREDALYGRIVQVTAAHFGRPINPHLFRDCLATSVAVDDPDHILIAAVLLGHASFATTDRYYIQAGSHQAVRRWQEYILSLRQGSTGPGTGEIEG